MRKHYKLHINTYDDMWDGNKLNKSSIKWEEQKNSWMFFNDNYQLTLEDLHLLGIPMVSESDDIDLKDKCVYRFPKLSLPRQKVDLLKDKYNCRVIRDINKADVAIVSLKLFDTILERTWGSSISCHSVYTILKYMKDIDIFTDKALMEVQAFLQDAPKTSMVDFRINGAYHLVQGSVRKKLHDDVKDFVEKNQLEDENAQSNWLLPVKNYKAFNDLINLKCKILLDTEVSSIIDSELAVIENDEYDNIISMVHSSDIDNRSLALEMLANCNVEKSFDVVSGIYFWDYPYLKNTNNWNSVNVKTLRNRLKSYEGNHDTVNIWSFNKYLSTLSKDRKLTRFAADRTREKLMKTLMGNIVGKESQVFKVDLENLYIAEEIENTINE
tara:strand:- start:2827 stop:3978 length:1152 start_codon:yes stop_codon:yes gene_type:complete